MNESREPTVVFTHSTRSWMQELHFFLVDHGGAVVVGHALTADEARSAAGDVFVVDDVSSFLNQRLVADLHAAGRSVLGVFDPADVGAGEERLRALGVDDIISADSSPVSFVAAIAALAAAPASSAVAIPATAGEDDADLAPVVAVAAASGGAGATEVALALAPMLRARSGAVVVVDVDEATPSIAQRRGLPLHPNLLSAVEAVQHGNGSLEDCLIRDRAIGVQVLGGLPNPSRWRELRPFDVVAVVRDIGRRARVVVANTGSRIEDISAPGVAGRYAITRAVVGVADVVVVVANATPIGVARLFEWFSAAENLVSRFDVHVVVNFVPRGRFRSSQVAAEILDLARPASVTLIGADPAVTRAAWQGAPVPRGSFRRGVAALAECVSAAAAL